MTHQFSRNELAIGREGVKLLQEISVAILGVGGVGSFTAEALARSGVGRLILIDKDVVDITNVNRQIHALISTVGQSKVKLMKDRIAQINPNCEVVTLEMFYTEETYEKLFAHNIDFVVDAADTVSYKIHIIKQCHERNIPIISCMGVANKLDPTRLQIADISKTHTDPLAKVVRTRLRKDGINDGVPVVFTDESPIVVRDDILKEIGMADSTIRKSQIPPSSNAFVPSTAGLIMASYVVNETIKDIPIRRIADGNK